MCDLQLYIIHVIRAARTQLYKLNSLSSKSNGKLCACNGFDSNKRSRSLWRSPKNACISCFVFFISMLDLVKFCIRNVSNNLSSIQKLLIIHNHVFPIFNSLLLLPLLLSSSSHFRSFFLQCVYCVCVVFFFVLFCINLLANSILAHETFYFVCWALPSPLDFINAYTLIYLIAIFFASPLSLSYYIHQSFSSSKVPTTNFSACRTLNKQLKYLSLGQSLIASANLLPGFFPVQLVVNVHSGVFLPTTPNCWIYVCLIFSRFDYRMPLCARSITIILKFMQFSSL